MLQGESCSLPEKCLNPKGYIFHLKKKKKKSGKKTDNLLALNCKLTANSSFPLKDLVETLKKKKVFIFIMLPN